MFSRILVSGLFAGFAAGLIAALLQLAFVQPILLHAELYESGQLTHFGGAKAGAVAAAGDVDVDLVRDGLSVLFTTLLYTGYALILVAAMALAEERGFRIAVRQGLLWGLAGFVAVQFAPAVGVPPELPGSAAADIGLRRLWWLGTVGATAAGIVLIACGKGWTARGIAAVLILAPHVIGAPHPETFAGPAPPELAAMFAGRALGVGLVAWALLGLFAAWFWIREGKRTEDAARTA
ncbi:MAG: CbtA family protein [Defluviicoccus sp.]|nr:CbtA family protein [Defluviicoccus sp.]